MLRSLCQQMTHEQIGELFSVSARTVQRWEKDEAACPPFLGDAIRMHLDLQSRQPHFTFADLFAGIGGTRLAFEGLGGECVFTCERDPFAKQTYSMNFARPAAHVFKPDLTRVGLEEIPSHDLLLAGLPCQPFSIAGVSKRNALGLPHGFKDLTQGTLFFDVATIISKKQPKAFVLENVKNLKSHDRGKTFEVIMRTLREDLGYQVSAEVIDSVPFVPQCRRRVFIVGVRGDQEEFDFDKVQTPVTSPRMSAVLHPEDGTELPEAHYTQGRFARVSERYTLTAHMWNYLQEYAARHRQAGHGFGFGLVGPNDIARTLSARYYKDGSEILVSRGSGRIPRRLTPRESARLMGFPDSFRIPVSDTQAYRQFGNSVVVPVVRAVADALSSALESSATT